jgi:hypothetical protein
MTVYCCRCLGNTYDSILVRVLIVVICLIIIASVLVITIGYSRNESQPNQQVPSNGENESRRIVDREEPCILRGKEITCSHIDDNTGELVADYINTHSDEVSEVNAYCYLPRLTRGQRVHTLTPLLAKLTNV